MAVDDDEVVLQVRQAEGVAKVEDAMSPLHQFVVPRATLQVPTGAGGLSLLKTRSWFPMRADLTRSSPDGLDFGCADRMMAGPEHVVHSRLAARKLFDGHTEAAPLAGPWNTTKRAWIHGDPRR